MERSQPRAADEAQDLLGSRFLQSVDLDLVKVFCELVKRYHLHLGHSIHFHMSFTQRCKRPSTAGASDLIYLAGLPRLFTTGNGCGVAFHA
jgi:hypothetical protein